MSNSSSTIIVLIAFLAGFPGALASGIRYEDKFDQLENFSRESIEKDTSSFSHRFLVEYEKLFGEISKKNVDNIETDDLDFVFRAGHMAIFYTRDSKPIPLMEAVVRELEDRSVIATRHYIDLYDSYVATRLLDKAKRIHRDHYASAMGFLPDFREAGEIISGVTTEWRLDLEDRALIRTGVELNQQLQIIVVSHPECGYSRQAFYWIMSDSGLAPTFKSKAKWLAPVSGRLDIDSFEEWNRKHPETPMTIGYKENEWPMIDAWATPTFYFLRDGKVFYKVSGWPKGGRIEELTKVLEGNMVLSKSQAAPKSVLSRDYRK